jgi:hypothetical protein
MNPIRRLAILIPLLAAAGCATNPDILNASGSDRELGIVRVSYEFAQETDPGLDDEQAARIAENRCESWGYKHTARIPGNLRSCSAKSGERCEVWKVTREYQCTQDAAFAQHLSR